MEYISYQTETAWNNNKFVVKGANRSKKICCYAIMVSKEDIEEIEFLMKEVIQIIFIWISH